MEESARSILNQILDPISITDVLQKYPVKYEESMNTVLAQEVTRYNKLLVTVKQTLMVFIIKYLFCRGAGWLSCVSEVILYG